MPQNCAKHHANDTLCLKVLVFFLSCSSSKHLLEPPPLRIPPTDSSLTENQSNRLSVDGKSVWRILCWRKISPTDSQLTENQFRGFFVDGKSVQQIVRCRKISWEDSLLTKNQSNRFYLLEPPPLRIPPTDSSLTENQSNRFFVEGTWVERILRWRKISPTDSSLTEHQLPNSLSESSGSHSVLFHLSRLLKKPWSHGSDGTQPFIIDFVWCYERLTLALSCWAKWSSFFHK